MFSAGIKTEMTRQRVDISSYLSLYTPSLDWILHGLAVVAEDSLLDEILTKCQDKKNNGLLLNSIMTSFRQEFIANRAIHFVSILSQSTTDGITKSQLFRSLGHCLSFYPPSDDQMSEVWLNVSNIFSTFTDPAEYITCVEMWAAFVAKHFDVRR